jgi:hypothetical protein
LLVTIAVEQHERCAAFVQRQHKAAALDLADLPSADVVTNLDAINLIRAGADDGARAFIVYHDAK